MKSASGRATEAAIIHCSSLSELRCAVCTGAPGRKGAYFKLLRGTKRRRVPAATRERGDDRSNPPLDHLQLELGDRFRRVETLRAGFCAIHDGVAAIQPERVLEIVEPLACSFVAAVGDPARRLQQRGRAEKTFAVPPVARARGRAAGAQDAFVEAVEFFAVLVALLPFLLRC